MGLQTIIDMSSGLSINRRKLAGVQYTRNQISRTSLTPTYNPWRFSVDMPTSLKYSEARSLMEELDSLDVIYPENIKFSNNPKLSWLFRYQGAANYQQLNQIKVVSFLNNELILNSLPVIGATDILFAKNDLIQIYGYPYSFTSTTDILRGIGNDVTVLTHRPNFIPYNVNNLGITVGNFCDFRVFCPNMPTYKLIPGGTQYSGGTIVSNAYIEWSDSFELYEYLGDL